MSINTTRHRRSEAGMMSIIVTMIMMFVITLIVLGFAQISRREETQALNNQLSTQAFLAAETGVNDAHDAISTALKNGQPIEEKSTCGPYSSAGDPANSSADQYYKGKYDPKIDSARNIMYSCLLVSTHLQDISQVVPADGSSVTIPLHPAGPTKIMTLNITWYATPKVTTMAGCPNTVPAMGANTLKPATSWTCQYSMLRMDLVPTDTAVLDRSDLQSKNVGFFLYPALNANTFSTDTADGTVEGMKCNLVSCTAAITILPQNYTNYSMRLAALYQAGGTVDIQAEDASGTVLDLADAQVAIDSTGKAQNVLRRIQTRMSLVHSNSSSSYAIESAGPICKHFQVAAGIGISGVIGQDSHNPYCNSLAMP